jgi:hypothetical protein
LRPTKHCGAATRPVRRPVQRRSRSWCPMRGRTHGDSSRVQPSVELEEEQQAMPAQDQGVDGEEVAGMISGGLRPEETSPGLRGSSRRPVRWPALPAHVPPAFSSLVSSSGVVVTFEIAVDSDGQDLVRLRDWLREQPAIRRNVSVSLSRVSAEPASMGSVVELITLVTSTALSVASLLVAIADWRDSRPSAPSVTIRRGNVEVTITGGDRASVDDAIRMLGNERGERDE